MHLVSALASGFVAAPGGTATFSRFGTSTAATFYTDYNGVSSNTTGSLVLDTYGAAVVYVNSLVTVTVRNAAGATVATFTAGDSSSAVEYIGQSFTGVSPISGASGTNQHVLLSTILDLWKTQSGSIDFKGLGVDGTAYDIRSWIARLGGLVINVKDPDYAAAGDGTTDDTTAITNAIAAAAAGCGVVVFPAGTYLITSAITLTAGVSLLGVGPFATIIKMNSSGASHFTVSADTYWRQIAGIRFTQAQANTSSCIQSTTTSKLWVDNCYIGGTNFSGDLLALSTSSFRVTNSTLAVNITGKRAVNNVAGNLWVDHCLITTPATYSTSSSGTIECNFSTATYDVAISNCTFDFTTTSSGTFSGIYILIGSVTGCRFINATSGTATAMQGLTSNFSESNNTFGSTVAPYSGTFTSGSTFASLGSRLGRQKDYGTDNNAAVTIDSLSYGVAYLTRTDATNQVITLTDAPPGSEFTLVIFANGAAMVAAAHDMTFATNVHTGLGVLDTGVYYQVIANGAYAAIRLKAVILGGALHWVSHQANFTSGIAN